MPTGLDSERWTIFNKWSSTTFVMVLALNMIWVTDINIMFPVSYLFPGFRVCIHLIRIRIQHFRLNTDPDPIRMRGFFDQKLEKITAKKN